MFMHIQLTITIILFLSKTKFDSQLFLGSGYWGLLNKERESKYVISLAEKNGKIFTNFNAYIFIILTTYCFMLTGF